MQEPFPATLLKILIESAELGCVDKGTNLRMTVAFNAI